MCMPCRSTDLHADDLNLALPSPLALTPTGTRPRVSPPQAEGAIRRRAPAPLPVVGIAPETTYVGLFRAWSARVLDALTFDVAPARRSGCGLNRPSRRRTRTIGYRPCRCASSSRLTGRAGGSAGCGSSWSR